MVGVAGKSKGCTTCRKRKIRCGLERPKCNQCLKAKRDCPGYAKPTIFLNKSSHAFDLQSRDAFDAAYLASRYSPNRDQPPFSLSQDLQRQEAERYVTLPASLDATPFVQDAVLADFVNSTLPKSATRQPPLIWVTSILESADCPETLSLAGLAIGHGWQGHVRAQADRVMHSRRCYSHSLSLLRKDLMGRPTLFTETTLATMCALVLYELIEFGTHDARGWLAHTSGIEAITSQTTPQAFVAGSSHLVFLFCRVVLLLRSLLLRRTTFLGKNDWLHIPWTLHPKNPLHQLLDLVTEVVALLEASDIQHAGWSVGRYGEPSPENLLVSIALMVSRLRRWYACSETRLAEGPLAPTENKDGAQTLIPSEKSNNCHWYPARQPPEGAVSFDCLQQARLMLFYWALVLELEIEVFRSHILRTQLFQAHKIRDATHSARSAESDIQAAISIDLAIECADNIIRWFEFAAQNVWNSFGPAFGVFALKTAISWYKIYQSLPRSRASAQADRSDHLQQGQNMLLRLINVGSPPSRYS